MDYRDLVFRLADLDHPAACHLSQCRDITARPIDRRVQIPAMSDDEPPLGAVGLDRHIPSPQRFLQELQFRLLLQVTHLKDLPSQQDRPPRVGIGISLQFPERDGQIGLFSQLPRNCGTSPEERQEQNQSLETNLLQG